MLQDWAANARQPESQLILAWFRLAQWATARWGLLGGAVGTLYRLGSLLILGTELGVTARVGPRLRLYHPQGVVVSPHCTIGSDCQLRQNVTIGNTVDRDGNQLGVPRLGDHVELGAGCAVFGDVNVGDHARIGALAVVAKSVPAWAVVVGNPGRVLRIDTPPGQAAPAQDISEMSPAQGD